MKIIIEITGKDVDKLDADEIAELIFQKLDDEYYHVTVTGYCAMEIDRR